MEKTAQITQCLQPNQNGLRALNNSFGVYFDASDGFQPETENQLRERLTASGFLLGLADLTFDALTVDDFNREKIEKAQAFAKDPVGGLFICGEFGTGN